MHLKSFLVLLFLGFALMIPVRSFCQDPAARKNINLAIQTENFNEASSLVDREINYYLQQKLVDSVNEFLFLKGKVEFLRTNYVQANKKMLQLVNQIAEITSSAATLRQTYLELGEFYGYAGKHQQAYNSNKQALKYHEQDPGGTASGLGTIESNLSAYAQRLGNPGLAQFHARRSMASIESDPNPDYEKLYFAYNNAGVQHWFGSRMDSAKYFFKRSLEALSKADSTPENLYYRPAILQNNLCGIYSLEGNTTQAIEVARECIRNIKRYINVADPGKKKDDAKEFQFSATDNLAGIYKDLGDYKQAMHLLNYSYEQKKAELSTDDPAIFFSEILLGQLHYAMKEYDKAKKMLYLGIEKISKADGDYLFWHADACNTLALLYDAEKNIPEAEIYYTKAENLYEQANGGEYDNTYLEFLRNAALFYAQNDKASVALEKADRTYKYIQKTEGRKSLLTFYQLLNLSEVHLESGNYREAKNFSNQGLAVVEDVVRSSKNLLDSIKIELQKPQAILLKARAEYALLSTPNADSLKKILNNLNEGLSLLERRKSILQDGQDIVLLMSNHGELIEFIKKITLDLYNITESEEYAYSLVSLHESGIYNRIRARLDKTENIRFAHLPEKVRDEERKIKASILQALNGEGTHDQKMQAYMQSGRAWDNYLELLRKEYPDYYTMRYASIFRPVKQMISSIADDVTVIRYIYIGKELMAMVSEKEGSEFIKLGSADLDHDINMLTRNSMDISTASTALHRLYQKLWAPLNSAIHHKKIVIIPDGILYNLNFEILTPQKIASFRELSKKSLLAKYIFSYQYSLFLINQQRSSGNPDKNFVAFVPGFSDQVKDNYRVSRRDSIEIDNAYFSLLPQPFTISLVNKAKKLLEGDAYLNTESTLTAFRKNAGNNKIIHIGTHAESNNLYPEYSRLIFAKNTAEHTEENSLYLFDIYNCDLTSNLTVLTACESGKPGYKDGEGMISLAHAFSYAGSESIITGLWKIDEQSSNILMDYFYENLLAGMQKDEALREAKLSYLEKASGRTLAPQYWAGLVLIGDTSPVKIEKHSGRIILYVLIAVLLIAGIAGARKFFRK